MKKFLLKTTFFILPITLLLVGMEIFLRKIPNDYSYKRNYLDEHSNQLKTIYLGNSHAFYGINPMYVKETSFNAAHVSQSIDYDYKILLKYQDRFDSLKNIVLPIDYFTFYKNIETGAEKWRVKNYTIYYGFDGSPIPTNYLELLNGTLKDNFKRFQKYYFQKKSSISCNKYGWGKSYHSENQKDLISTGKIAASRHKAKSELAFNKNVQTLKDIMRFAQDHGTKVILYTSPCYKTYVQKLDRNQLSKTIETIQDIQKQFAFVKYHNLLEDESFDEKDFYDADHLNEIGAQKLTQKLDSLIHLN